MGATTAGMALGKVGKEFVRVRKHLCDAGVGRLRIGGRSLSAYWRLCRNSAASRCPF